MSHSPLLTSDEDFKTKEETQLHRLYETYGKETLLDITNFLDQPNFRDADEECQKILCCSPNSEAHWKALGDLYRTVEPHIENRNPQAVMDVLAYCAFGRAFITQRKMIKLAQEKGVLRSE